MSENNRQKVVRNALSEKLEASRECRIKKKKQNKKYQGILFLAENKDHPLGKSLVSSRN